MRSLLVLAFLVLLELVLGFFFIRGILTGAGDNLLLGTILGAQFLIMASVMVVFFLQSVPPRVVAEDRDEGLLW
jgi:cadmium resistance protein CadD (predicted permease)